MNLEGSDERALMALLHEGRAPSECDALLEMPDGWAHDTAVLIWARDKRERAEELRRIREAKRR